MKKNEYPVWLIPLELAKELKDLGFDESCIFSYSEGIGITACLKNGSSNEPLISDFVIGGNMPNSPFTDLPTFEQAFSWFRNKGYKANINYIFHPDLKCKIGYLYEIIHDFAWEKYSSYYISYEIAREECLKELIKIYKEKQNERINS